MWTKLILIFSLTSTCWAAQAPALKHKDQTIRGKTVFDLREELRDSNEIKAFYQRRKFEHLEKLRRSRASIEELLLVEELYEEALRRELAQRWRADHQNKNFFTPLPNDLNH